MPRGVYTAADRDAMKSYCRQCELETEAFEAYRLDGRLVIDCKGGGTRQNPLLSLIRNAALARARFGEELGLNPTARARMDMPKGMATGDDPESLLDGARIVEVGGK